MHCIQLEFLGQYINQRTFSTAAVTADKNIALHVGNSFQKGFKPALGFAFYMKRVLAFGTFDVLHPGHLYYLRRAKALGNELWVVVARDSTVQKLKGFKTVYSENERLALVSALKYVDFAFLGDKKDMWKSVVRAKPQIIALGHDHRISKHHHFEKFHELEIKPRLVRIPSFNHHKYKSSKIKKRIHKLHKRTRR